MIQQLKGAKWKDSRKERRLERGYIKGMSTTQAPFDLPFLTKD
jgi:hypothetical protein